MNGKNAAESRVSNKYKKAAPKPKIKFFVYIYFVLIATYIITQK